MHPLYPLKFSSIISVQYNSHYTIYLNNIVLWSYGGGGDAQEQELKTNRLECGEEKRERFRTGKGKETRIPKARQHFSKSGGVLGPLDVFKGQPAAL